MKLLLFILTLFTSITCIHAGNDYKQSPEFLALKDSMARAFNDGDSSRFFPALYKLEDYLLKQKDYHAYYTQRCNEIVFLMNRQCILEAYQKSHQIADELRKKKLDKEMYMAYNMLGHLNRYCGNKETAKENFRTVIKMMEEAGYYESMPPIYMNIVSVQGNDAPEEAQEMLTKALEIAKKYSPERVFDIETNRTLSYFNSGDTDKFLEGYKVYREGVKQGKSSVNGRVMEIYYQAATGHLDKAIELTQKNPDDEKYETLAMLYERNGQWKEAYETLKKLSAANDSINNVVLSNTMEGYKYQLTSYEAEQEVARTRTITLAIIIILLSLLIVALIYISYAHRKHMDQLKTAYNHALESDKLKTAFIQNMSHEMRTPLNVIAGFAQVLADPELSPDLEKRKEIASIIRHNNHLITNQIDEILELSQHEASSSVSKEDNVKVNDMLRKIIEDQRHLAASGVEMKLNTQLADDFTILTQHSMLLRAVNTVVDNAVKNTSKGSISISASKTEKTLSIIVEDTGCGIPAAEAEHIFERFVKLNSFKEGIGLGLPLCRSLISQLGGTISLDTTYTNGSRFVMKLNL